MAQRDGRLEGNVDLINPNKANQISKQDAVEVPAIKSLIEANSTLSARSLVTDRQSYSPEARHSASQRGDNRCSQA
jgi:hypothetical protein